MSDKKKLENHEKVCIFGAVVSILKMIHDLIVGFFTRKGE